MENQFTKPDTSKSSFNCSREEVAVYGGCRRYSDGIYRSLPRPGQYTLADGLRLLAVHSMADSADCAEVYLFMTGGPDTEQRELFYLTDHEKEALPCSRPLTRRMMHPICTAVLPSFPQHTALGRTMCIDCWEPSADNPGTLYLRWEGPEGGYTVIADPMADTTQSEPQTLAESSATPDDAAASPAASPQRLDHHCHPAPLPCILYGGNHTTNVRCHCRKTACNQDALRRRRILCRIRPGPASPF